MGSDTGLVGLHLVDDAELRADKQRLLTGVEKMLRQPLRWEDMV